MKQGDTVAVTIDGHIVANAVIESIEDGRATLLIPATRVIMGVRSTLTDLEREPDVDRALVSDGYVADTADDVGEGIRQEKLDSSAID